MARHEVTGGSRQRLGVDTDPSVARCEVSSDQDLRITVLVGHGAFAGAVFAARITPRGGLRGGLDPRAGRYRWRRYQLPSDFGSKYVEDVRDDLLLFHAVLDFKLGPDGAVFPGGTRRRRVGRH
jgi:hypothetical protein